MIDFLDTTILVAACQEQHPRHDPCLKLLARAKPSTCACAAHSIAETYAVLTRLPGFRLSPEEAGLFIDDVVSRVSLIALTGEEYAESIRNAREHGVGGGAIYDFLIARCAVKARARHIFTLDRDFERFAGQLAGRSRSP